MSKLNKHANPNITRMDKLFKQRAVEFLKFMSEQQRIHDIEMYESRIRSLESARDALRESPIRQLSRTEAKSASVLCNANQWTDEDAAKFVEEFLRTRGISGKQSPSGIVNGITKLGQALMTA